jgi:phosphoribosylglycinamide formyltransferase 1
VSYIFFAFFAAIQKNGGNIMGSQYRIAIFASGKGSNAEEIIKYFKNHPSISVDLIVSNNPNALVLERARRHNIPCLVFDKKEFDDMAAERLASLNITHIVLAGFLWLIPSKLLKTFPDRIINIHPALLPKFGGKGMYGMKIHELVRSSNEKESGITIHLVDEKYDEGTILYQHKCEVTNADTPQQIADKVHQLEYTWYPKIIEKWVIGSSERRRN